MDHFDGGGVVFVQVGRGILRKTEFTKDGTEVFRNLCSGDSGNKFGFRAASGSNGLGLGPIGNDTAREHEGVACGRSSATEVIGMGSIDVASESKMISSFRERREKRVIHQDVQWDG